VSPFERFRGILESSAAKQELELFIFIGSTDGYQHSGAQLKKKIDGEPTNAASSPAIFG
jgi:hypothetical protein